MEHRHHPDPLAFDEGPVLAGDPQIWLDQLHARDPAKGDDDPRADQARLLPEISDTAVLLILLRVAVLRRAAFDDVGDVDVFVTVEIDGIEHFVQQLSRSADKGLAFEVLLLARTFADEQDARIRFSYSENNVVPTFAQPALRTAQTSFFDFLPSAQNLHLISIILLQSD